MATHLWTEWTCLEMWLLRDACPERWHLCCSSHSGLDVIVPGHSTAKSFLHKSHVWPLCRKDVFAGCWSCLVVSSLHHCPVLKQEAPSCSQLYLYKPLVILSAYRQYSFDSDQEAEGAWDTFFLFPVWAQWAKIYCHAVLFGLKLALNSLFGFRPLHSNLKNKKIDF